MIQGKQLSLFLLLAGGLTLLSSCTKKQTTGNKPFRRNEAIYMHIQKTHGPVIKHINTINHPISKQELKNHIILYNNACSLFSDSYQYLPFMQYKNLIDKHVKQLQAYLRKLHKKQGYLHKLHKNTGEEYSRRKQEIQTLVVQLEKLNKAIITSKEYRQEKLKLAEQNIREREIRTFISQLEQLIKNSTAKIKIL